MRPRIFAMMQGLAGAGGIQRNSRAVCRALGEYAAARGMALDILSFTDPDGWHDPRYLARPLQGCDGSRARFVARAALALARPYDLLIVGQVDFGPLALLPQLIRPDAPMLTLTYGIEVWRPLPAHKLAALRIADRVVTISAYTACRLIELQGVLSERVRVMPCVLDPEFAAAVAALPPAAPVSGRLLAISRMAAHDTDKGIDEVIRALPALAARFPTVSFNVIGDGADRLRLERLADDLGVAERVQFLGRVPDERLHAELQTAEIFVLPSRKEGFGIVFLEAMAHGLPVVAGDHGGAPEVVADGETGLLIRHGDTAALTNALAALLGDPARRAALGEAGRRRATGQFTYSGARKRLHQILDELVTQRADAIGIQGQTQP